MNPENMTISQATEATQLGQAASAHTQRVLRALAGDHWQAGAGWIGPQLPSTNPMAGEFLAEVARQFMVKNVLLEVTNRHVGAVIGRYPLIKLALSDATAEPSAPEQARMRELEGVLTSWLDRTQALGKLQEFTTQLLLGRAHLRSYVPSGEVQGGVIPRGDLRTSIGRIRLMVPTPGSARVIDDEESGRRYALYNTVTAQGEATEITYLTPDGQTVTRRIEGSVTAEVAQAEVQARATAALALGGHLTITEATRQQFLTPSLWRNQLQVNFAKTAIVRNAELAATLERYGLGIMPPGQWIADSNVPGGMRYEVDRDWRPGGAGVAFFQGQTVIGGDGVERGVGSAQYGRFEPVSPAPLVATKDDAYHDMLDEAAQGHIRMSGDATASGESRIQAMNDFKVSLYATATAIEHALSAHLEMVLSWGLALAGRTGELRPYRVVVQCRILAAQPTVTDRAQVIAEVAAGLRSVESGMSEIGIEDTDQMLQQVSKEQEEKAKQQAQAQALERADAGRGGEDGRQ